MKTDYRRRRRVFYCRRPCHDGRYDFTFVNDCFATRNDHDTMKFCYTMN